MRMAVEGLRGLKHKTCDGEGAKKNEFSGVRLKNSLECMQKRNYSLCAQSVVGVFLFLFLRKENVKGDECGW